MAPVMTPKTARPAAVARPAGAARRFAKIAMGGVAAVALSTLPANAFEVKMGGDDGSLAFVPDKISVKAGEEIKFVNNAGFPHNIVFDEDEVPVRAQLSAFTPSGARVDVRYGRFAFRWGLSSASVWLVFTRKVQLSSFDYHHERSDAYKQRLEHVAQCCSTPTLSWQTQASSAPTSAGRYRLVMCASLCAHGSVILARRSGRHRCPRLVALCRRAFS